MTPIASEIRLGCPVGSRGEAIWYCSSITNQWEPKSGPDLSRCYSDWSRQLKLDVDESHEEVNAQLQTIQEIHSYLRKERIFGGDLINLVYTLSKTIRNYENLINFDEKLSWQNRSLTNNQITKVIFTIEKKFKIYYRILKT